MKQNFYCPLEKHFEPFLLNYRCHFQFSITNSNNKTTVVTNIQKCAFVFILTAVVGFCLHGHSLSVVCIIIYLCVHVLCI